jgi:hypothetical protein
MATHPDTVFILCNNVGWADALIDRVCPPADPPANQIDAVAPFGALV